MVSSSKNSAHDVNNIAEETGEIPHPHELYVPLLTFIPTKSPVLSRPWVLVTSSFVEENFLGLSMSVLTIFYLGKYLENMWGGKDFTRFLIANLLIGNVTMYLYFKVLHIIVDFKEVPPVVETPMAIIMGLFVALKQRILQHYFLFFKGYLRIKVNYLPFLIITSFFILQLISEEFRISFDLSIIGFITSWIYLRMFKEGTNERQSYLLPFSLSRKRSNKVKKVKRSTTIDSNTTSANSSHIDLDQTSSLHIETTTIKGDRSEQFALYTFFPSPLSFIVKIISNSIFTLLCKYHFLDHKDFLTEDIDDDQYMFEDMDNLQSKLFGLSTLNGAQNVSPIGKTNSKITDLWNWLTNKTIKKSINSSMEKRRKQALKQFE